MAEKEVTVEPKAEKKVHHKIAWSLEKCRKIASRYTSPDEWSYGAPSSYKAAVARGWDKECCAHMTNLKPLKANPTAKSTAKKNGVGKGKAAPRKSA
jgi:hypothetical protein